MDDTVFLISHHHSDLVWRRTKQAYDRVREEQILQVFDWLERYPAFTFTFAQTDVVKTFIRQHPELKQAFRDHVAAGRIELVGGMVAIPDTNLVEGEALVRNIVLGRRYFRQEFGVDVRIGWLMDAFGMSAQMPQILAKSGFRFLLPGRTPGLPSEGFVKGFLWLGPDGAAIPTATPEASVQLGTHVCNVPVTYTPRERLRVSLADMAALDGDVGVGDGQGGEEARAAIDADHLEGLAFEAAAEEVGEEAFPLGGALGRRQAVVDDLLPAVGSEPEGNQDGTA